jgi:EmrB/QacA subfamily drug resistance transporter
VIVPLIVACALFMQNLDSTCLATALPAIAASLDEPVIRLHLAITSYLLALAVFLPVSGWVADRFGARLVFRIAIGIFSLGSAMCALSLNFGDLIVARLVQGLGGAMMVPVGRLILVRSVDKSELVAAMVLMSMPAVIGPVMGPLLGGFVTTYASWRWIFWINVPVGFIGILLVTKFIEEVRESEVKRFDWIGFFLSSFGLGGTLFAMDTGGTGHGVDPLSLAVFIAGLVTLILYVFHALRVDNPILDLRLFKIVTFRVSITGGSVFRLGVGAVPFLLPLLMQEGFGYTPFQSGAITFVSAAGAFGMRTIARQVLRRFGFRTVLIWNAVIAGGFISLCAIFKADTPRALMMAIIFFGGVFRSLEFTSLSAIAFADVESPQMSHATSLQQMAQRVSQSLGVAISAFILQILGGDAPGVPTFAWAFVLIGILSATSAASFFQLHSDAGAVLAGRSSGDRQLAPARAD